MHPDGFPVPKERDFYWKNIVLSFKTPVQIELVEHSNKTIARCKNSRAKAKRRVRSDRTSALTL
jgi:hypothetical protein